VISFFKHLKNMFGIMGLPKERRALVFYCENKNYWVHLKPIIEQLLEQSDQSICYISSHADDPGLALDHPQISAFEIGEGAIRNYVFENLDADLMVLTMPDLHQYQVKKSRHGVHYVYVQHSLVSLHSVYRTGAFDHYDTIFCAGPHHEKEVELLVKTRNLNPIETYKSDPLFEFESGVDGQASLQASDVMVSDWSGAALEYAFGLRKPVLFVDVTQKIQNKNYTDSGLIAFEDTIRGDIGSVIATDTLGQVGDAIAALMKKDFLNTPAPAKVYNLGNSGQAGAKKILEILSRIEASGGR